MVQLLLLIRDKLVLREPHLIQIKILAKLYVVMVLSMILRIERMIMKMMVMGVVRSVKLSQTLYVVEEVIQGLTLVLNVIMEVHLMMILHHE